jgi:hypothetical protein
VQVADDLVSRFDFAKIEIGRPVRVNDESKRPPLQETNTKDGRSRHNRMGLCFPKLKD